MPTRLLEGVVFLLHRLLDRHIRPEQRERLRVIIFRTDTEEGLLFDSILFGLIVASVIVVILETVADFHDRFWWFFFILEWVFTLIFTVEYLLRLYVARYPVRYATSFFGLVDLLSILPTYLSLFYSGPQHLLIIRILRLMRVFRVFKLGHFVNEGGVVMNALRA
ncbi:MAG: ion transporter, partial [Bacteroidetes bacterium]